MVYQFFTFIFKYCFRWRGRILLFIIFLLLTLAIILVLGVVLYQYVPTNKIIPETVSYTTPEKVKAELQTDENVDTSEVVVTYQIDSTDLSNYKRINEYVSGRKNPFASTGTQSTTGGTTDTSNSGNTSSAGSSNSNSGTSSSGTSSASGNTSNSSSSSSGYLPDKGTK